MDGTERYAGKAGEYHFPHLYSDEEIKKAPCQEEKEIGISCR
jgi:hypothetical protein